MALSVDQILDGIKELKAIELSDLVKKIEEEFGVSAAAPMPMMGMMPVGEAAAPVEEKTKFDVILVSGGDKQIQVIKAVRAIVSGLGLKEAKDLVTAGNKAVLEGVSKEDAEKAKAALEEAGATVQMK